MSFRTAMLKVCDQARSIAGPNGLDIRTNQLTIRTRTWSGGRVRLGTASDADLVLPKQYPIRYVAAHVIQASGGEYELGDISINHITPFDGVDVGYTLDQLRPEVTTNGVEVLYVITGEHEGEYTLIDAQTYRPFSYRLILRRRATVST